jgi:hypothetical protein
MDGQSNGTINDDELTEFDHVPQVNWQVMHDPHQIHEEQAVDAGEVGVK